MNYSTCIAAAPRTPQVKKTSDEAAIQDFPFKKNSCQTVAGNN